MVTDIGTRDTVLTRQLAGWLAGSEEDDLAPSVAGTGQRVHRVVWLYGLRIVSVCVVYVPDGAAHNRPAAKHSRSSDTNALLKTIPSQ